MQKIYLIRLLLLSVFSTFPPLYAENFTQDVGAETDYVVNTLHINKFHAEIGALMQQEQKNYPDISLKKYGQNIKKLFNGLLEIKKLVEKDQMLSQVLLNTIEKTNIEELMTTQKTLEQKIEMMNQAIDAHIEHEQKMHSDLYLEDLGGNLKKITRAGIKAMQYFQDTRLVRLTEKITEIALKYKLNTIF